MGSKESAHCLTLWLCVVDGTRGGWMGVTGRVLFRYLPTPCPPTTGDRVDLWDDGPLWTVARRSLCHDGIWSIELTRMVVDAPANARPRGPDDYYWRGWNTELDGDPVPHLLAAGWTEL